LRHGAATAAPSAAGDEHVRLGDQLAERPFGDRLFELSEAVIAELLPEPLERSLVAQPSGGAGMRTRARLR
jgi:hypothetical protein